VSHVKCHSALFELKKRWCDCQELCRAYLVASVFTLYPMSWVEAFIAKGFYLAKPIPPAMKTPIISPSPEPALPANKLLVSAFTASSSSLAP